MRPPFPPRRAAAATGTTQADRGVGWSRALTAAYAFMALAAGARAVVQIATEFDAAPLAFVLSAASAAIYLLAAAALRRRVGYIPTNPQFPRHMTPIVYLDYMARLFGLPSEVRKPRLASLIRAVDLLSHAGQPIAGFSNGMTARLAVANVSRCSWPGSPVNTIMSMRPGASTQPSQLTI